MAIVEKNVKKPLFSFSRNPFYLIGTVLFVATWLFPFLGPAHDNILLKVGDQHALYLYQFLLEIPQYFAAIELRGSIFATMVEFVALVFCAGCILIALTTSVLALIFSHKNQHQTALWFSAIAVFTSLGYLFLCLEYDETPLLLYRAFGIGYIFFFCGNTMFLIGNQFAIKKAGKCRG